MPSRIRMEMESERTAWRRLPLQLLTARSMRGALVRSASRLVSLAASMGYKAGELQVHVRYP